MLDTDILSDLIKNPGGRASQRMLSVDQGLLSTSVIVAAELRYGCAKKGSAPLLQKVDALLAEIPALPLEIPADLDYGAVRAALEAMGQPIGYNDMLIAAHAISLGATLVTANEREFRRIAGLKVENWLA